MPSILAPAPSAVEPQTPAPLPASAPKLLLMIDGMAAISDGGTERQLLQLAGVARRAGLAPTICVLRETRWLTEAIAGCPVAHFSFGSIRSLAGWHELRRLLLWMRSQRFNVLQTFFTDSNLIGPLLGRCAGIPAILGTRRSLNEGLPLPAFPVRLLSRLSTRAVTQVLTNAEAVSRCMRVSEGIPAEKLSVVYNGVDLEQLQVPRALGATVRTSLGLGEHHLLVGNISGLRPVKRLDLFIRAAALAHARAPQLRFVVVGEGTVRPQLEALVEEHHLEGVVALVGAQDDVLPYLAAMDIAVLCSDAEGFSNSILEYMAAGLPVVATDVGGNREALAEAGLLVPPGDAARLAEAILLVADPGARRRFSDLAKKRVQRFSLETAQARMAEIYRAYCPQLDAEGMHPPAHHSEGSRQM